jgi:hypothetical protein
MWLKYVMSQLVQPLLNTNLEFNSKEESGMPSGWKKGTKITYGKKQLKQNSNSSQTFIVLYSGEAIHKGY